MENEELKVQERVKIIKNYLITHGTTRGLVIEGLDSIYSFINFLKIHADKFKDITFTEREKI